MKEARPIGRSARAFVQHNVPFLVIFMCVLTIFIVSVQAVGTGSPLYLTPHSENVHVQHDQEHGVWQVRLFEDISFGSYDGLIDKIYVSITDGYNMYEDELGVWTEDGVEMSGHLGNIAYEYANGVLALEGDATSAEYKSVLEEVVYRNTSSLPYPMQRTVRVEVGDTNWDVTVYDEQLNRYYMFVEDELSWSDAHAAAHATELYGAWGYLATIMSEEENTVVASIAQDDAWLGGTNHWDDDVGFPFPGQTSSGKAPFWGWVTGPPEENIIFSANGNSYQGAFVNWFSPWPTGSHPGLPGHVGYYTFMYGRESGLKYGTWDFAAWHCDIVQTSTGANNCLDENHFTHPIKPGYIVEFGSFSDSVKVHAEVSVLFPPPPEMDDSFDPSRSAIYLNEDIVAVGTVTVATLVLKDENNNPYNGPFPDVSIRHAKVWGMSYEGDGTYTVAILAERPGTTDVVVRLGEQTLRSNSMLTIRKTGVNDDEPLVHISQDEHTLYRDKEWLLIDDAFHIGGMRDNSSLTSAHVRIVEGLQPNIDALGFFVDDEWHDAHTIELANGLLKAHYENNEGVLTIEAIEGEVGWEHYQAVLRTVAYRKKDGVTSDVDNARRIEIAIDKEMPNRDVLNDPDLEYFYEFVPAYNLSWEEAEVAAGNRTLFGYQGYLATIMSQEENDIIAHFAKHSAWIGASDVDEPQVWRWMTGPETGQVFWWGLYDGHVEPGMFANWGSGEPNHYGESPYGPEHWVQIFGSDATKLPDVGEGDIGKWNDLPMYQPEWAEGYIVKYGGLPGDPEQVRFSDSITIHFSNALPVEPDFSWTPEMPRFGRPVQFDNTTNLDPESSYTFTWYFGDGSDSDEKHPSHTFAQTGKYDVTLQVMDERGMTYEVSQTVTVTADVAGYIFHDRNRDGVRGTGDSGIGLSDMYVILQQDGVVVAVAPDSQAGHSVDWNSGEYFFSALEPGLYDVIVTDDPDNFNPFVPLGWFLTTQDGTQPTQSVRVSELPVLAPGVKHGPNFGFAYGVIIRGTVFWDDGAEGGIPNDGKRNGGERGIGGMRVRITGDNDALLATTLTDNDGAYAIIVDIFEGNVVPDQVYIHLVAGTNDLYPTGYTLGEGAAGELYTPADGDMVVPVAIDETKDEYNGYDMGVVPGITVRADSNGQAGRGGFAVYPFTVRLGTAGILQFDVDSARHWNYDVYYDHQGDGDLAGSSLLPQGVTGELNVGDHAFLLVAHVPTEAFNGLSDTARVDTKFTFSGNSAWQLNEVFSTTTSVRAEQIRLRVDLRNVTMNEPVAGYTRRSVEAETGDIIEYRMTYENEGHTRVTDMAVTVTIPEGTSPVEYDDDGGKFVKWVIGNGEVIQTATGFLIVVPELEAYTSGVFTYRVQLH